MGLLCFLLSCNTKGNKAIDAIGGSDGPTAIFATSKSHDYYSRLIKEGFELITTMKGLATDSNFFHLCCYTDKVMEEVQSLNMQDALHPSHIFAMNRLERNIQDQEKLQECSKNIFVNRMVRSIPMKINSFEGSSWLAASSLLVIDKAFIDKKLKETKLLIYQYDNGLNVFVLFTPQEDHIVQAYACLVKNKELSNFENEEELVHFFEEYLHIPNVIAERCL